MTTDTTDYFKLLGNDFVLDLDGLEEAPEEVVVGGEKTIFAKVRFFQLFVNPFAGGERFTLPGVKAVEFEEDTNTSIALDSLHQFYGKPVKASKYRLHIFVEWRLNIAKEWYQRRPSIFKGWGDRCKRCKGTGLFNDVSCQECDGRGSNVIAWNLFQYPELLKLTKVTRQRLMKSSKEPLYISYIEADTDLKGQYDMKKYRTEIKLFSNQNDWEEANEAHFGQFNDTGINDAGNPNLEYLDLLDDNWKKSEKSDPGCFLRTYNLFRGQDKTSEECFKLMSVEPKDEEELIRVLEEMPF